MADIAGDFEEGVRLSNRVLAVRGQVVPVAPIALNLHAELADGTVLEGQSRIMRSRGIRRVWISPARVEASAEAVEAIRGADLIVMGPGSLYTSLLPSLLVPGIRSAIESAPGLRVYVSNVATQPGETEGYTLSEHLAALNAHDVGHLADIVLANDDHDARDARGLRRPAGPHRPARRAAAGRGVVLAGVVDPTHAHRHDPRPPHRRARPAHGGASRDPAAGPSRTRTPPDAEPASCPTHGTATSSRPSARSSPRSTRRARAAASPNAHGLGRAATGRARSAVVARLAVRLADDGRGGRPHAR